MPRNVLLTGPPRSGKTTVVQRVVDRLRGRGVAVGGILSPERREDGERVGFDVVDLATGARRTMAHVAFETGPSVGKYRVDVAAVDERAGEAIRRARRDADVVVIDEIAPMEVRSGAFCTAVRRTLEADRPLIATIHYRSTAGFIGAVKERDDVAPIDVTPETRDGLPDRLVETVCGWLET